MAQILIGGLDDQIVQRLRARAARAGRTLEEECRVVLVEAANRPDVLRAVEAWRAAWPGGEDGSDPFVDVRQRGWGAWSTSVEVASRRVG